VFTGLCAKHGIGQSMSRGRVVSPQRPRRKLPPDATSELVYRIALTSKALDRSRVTAWIGRYNLTHRQSVCGLESPIP